MAEKKTAPAKAQAEKQAPKAAKAQAVSKGEASGFRVGDTGIKVGGMVYAAGSVIPKELVTDELAPYLVGDADVEDTSGEVIVATTIPASTTTPQGGETPNADGSLPSQTLPQGDATAPT